MSDSNGNLSPREIISNQHGSASLPAPHTSKEWEEGNGRFRCILFVQLPNGGTRSFGGDGDSAKSARISATFRASFGLKMLAMNDKLDAESTDSSSTNDTGGSDNDENNGDEGDADGLRQAVVSSVTRDGAAVTSPVTGTKSPSSASTSSSDSGDETDDRGGADDGDEEIGIVPVTEPLIFAPSSEQPANHTSYDSDDEVQIVEECSTKRRQGSVEKLDVRPASVFTPSADAKKQNVKELTSQLDYSSPSDGEVEEETHLHTFRKNLRTPTSETGRVDKLKSDPQYESQTHAQSRTPSSGHPSAPQTIADSDASSDTPRTPFARVRTSKGSRSSPVSVSPSKERQYGEVPPRWMQRKSQRSPSPSAKSRKFRRTLLVSPSTSPLRIPADEVRENGRPSLPADPTTANYRYTQFGGDQAWNSIPSLPPARGEGGAVPIPRIKTPNIPPLPLPHSNRTSLSNSAGVLRSRPTAPGLGASHDMSNAPMPIPHHGGMNMSHVAMDVPPRPHQSQFMGYGSAVHAPQYAHPSHPSLPVAPHQPPQYPSVPTYASSHHVPAPMLSGHQHLPAHQATGPHQAPLPPHSVYVPPGQHLPYQHNMMRSATSNEYEYVGIQHPQQHLSNGVQYPSIPSGAASSHGNAHALDQYKEYSLEMVGRIAREAAIKDVTASKRKPQHQPSSETGHTDAAMNSGKSEGENFSTPKPSAQTTLTEISSDEECDGQDHISALQTMVHRGKKFGSINYNHESIINENGACNRWICTVTLGLVRATTGEGVLRKEAEGRTKIKSKQRAAKKAIVAIRESGLGSNQEASTKVIEVLDAAPAPEKGNGIRDCFGALNQLWHLNVLKYRPDFEFSEVGDMEGGQWKSTVVLHVEDRGMITLHDTAGTKKAAKAAVAQKAFEHLKKLKVRHIDIFKNVQARSLKPSIKRNDEPPAEENGETVVDIVRISDDDEDDLPDEMELPVNSASHFVVPDTYELVIASTTKQCEDWLSQNVSVGADVGLFVDSWSARGAFEDSASQTSQSPFHGSGKLKRPVLCFSTASSGLVLRADKCKDERMAESRLEDNFWLPEAAEATLKDARVRKHGHSIDCGAMRLSKLSNVRFRGMQDVAVTSFSVSEFSASDGEKVLPNLSKLVQHWLEKEFVGTVGRRIWGGLAKAPHELISPACEDDEALGIAILSAYACSCVQERIQVACESKRMRRHSSDEFLELSRRLLQNPFA